LSVAEYLSVFISIIVGLAVADLLISLHRLIRMGSRVKWYWLVLAIAFYMLLVIVAFWWSNFWWFGHVKSLTMAEFLPMLMVAIAIFLLAAAVLPDEVPTGELDLKAWYLENASQIWILAAIALGLTIINAGAYVSAILKDAGSFSWPYFGKRFLLSQWDNLISLAAYIWLIFTKRLRVHEACVVLGLIDMAYTTATFSIG
jgi:hypothetical protein